jgi:AcrR family transcriptional regulator
MKAYHALGSFLIRHTHDMEPEVWFHNERSKMSDRRTALLAAAVEEIALKGTRGMRVEEVAKRAQVSPALIYHHFGDRATLLQSALVYVGERATYTEQGEGTAREKLLANLLDEIQDDPAVRTNSTAWGELRDSAIFNEALRPAIWDLTNRWAEDVAKLIKDGSADGSMNASLNSHQLGVQMTAAVEAISTRWLAGFFSTAVARAHLEAMVEALLGNADTH